MEFSNFKKLIRTTNRWYKKILKLFHNLCPMSMLCEARIFLGRFYCNTKHEMTQQRSLSFLYIFFRIVERCRWFTQHVIELVVVVCTFAMNWRMPMKCGVVILVIVLFLLVQFQRMKMLKNRNRTSNWKWNENWWRWRDILFFTQNRNENGKVMIFFLLRIHLSRLSREISSMLKRKPNNVFDPEILFTRHFWCVHISAQAMDNEATKFTQSVHSYICSRYIQ